MEKDFDNIRIIVHGQEPEEPEDQKPTPKEVFRQAVGWAVAAVLVLIVPVLIVCRDPLRILAVVGSVVAIAAVYTAVACKGGGT